MQSARNQEQREANKPSHLLLEDFFRRQYGKCVAFLTRRLGHKQMGLAEEAVQESLARAVQVWPMRGIPDDPEAWILRVAYRHAIDVCRKEARLQTLLPNLRAAIDEVPRSSAAETGFATELHDDSLAMMFMCCHPGLSPLSRVALTLKVVSGFGVSEIAAACFAAPTTVAQRIVRAKARLRDLDISMDIPPPEHLTERLSSVLDVVYLLFNEGYTCCDRETPLQLDVIGEALRLIEALLAHPVGQVPKAHALAALLLFQASRSQARFDSEGALVPLMEQERALWDQGLITRALQHLAKAAAGRSLTEYHLLAGIAACHATAPLAAQTPWHRIAGLYDQLVALNGGFVTQLNRAVAHSRAHGPAAGLSLLDQLAARKSLQSYHLMAAARADCLVRLGRYSEAKDAFARAASLATSVRERQFFAARAASLEALAADEGADNPQGSVVLLFPDTLEKPLTWEATLDEDDKGHPFPLPEEKA